MHEQVIHIVFALRCKYECMVACIVVIIFIHNINCTVDWGTSNEITYTQYQTSPIFASDGSYSSITEHTVAGIALLALDHPLTFNPNLTDQALHNSFKPPLPSPAPQNWHHTNRCQSRRSPCPSPCTHACTKNISRSVNDRRARTFAI